MRGGVDMSMGMGMGMGIGIGIGIWNTLVLHIGIGLWVLCCVGDVVGVNGGASWWLGSPRLTSSPCSLARMMEGKVPLMRKGCVRMVPAKPDLKLVGRVAAWG